MCGLLLLWPCTPLCYETWMQAKQYLFFLPIICTKYICSKVVQTHWTLFFLFSFHTAECKVDADCVYDKACINGNCLNPCTYGSGSQCGRGAECHVQAHRAQCVCPPGTQGNPLLSCVSVVCQYNEDCADDEACDRLNRVCRLVCESDTCAETAVCIGRDHQPKCICPPGTTGNAYIECTGMWKDLLPVKRMMLCKL